MAFCFLDESPAFLAVQGEHSRAKQVLRRMRRLNGSAGGDVEYRPPPRVEPQTWFEVPQTALRHIFGRQYLWRTLTLLYSYVVVNFVFYGNLYAFPQVLPSASNLAVSPVMSQAL